MWATAERTRCPHWGLLLRHVSPGQLSLLLLQLLQLLAGRLLHALCLRQALLQLGHDLVALACELALRGGHLALECLQLQVQRLACPLLGDEGRPLRPLGLDDGTETGVGEGLKRADRL
eukprot:6767679-Pyramimonas_sp.AAC.1